MVAGAIELEKFCAGRVTLALAANAAYRDERFPSAIESSGDASVRANAGKRLPLVGEVEVNIIEEGTPRLLAFNSQQIDYLRSWVSVPIS